MAADLCLFLLQSLAGECGSSTPEFSPLVLGAGTVDLDPAHTNNILNPAIASIEASITPQFAASHRCPPAPLAGFFSCQSAPDLGDLGTHVPTAAVPATHAVAKAVPSPPALPAPLALPLTAPLATLPMVRAPQFTPPQYQPPTPQPVRRPASGPQLYRQRELALQAGQLYTRLSPDRFAESWHDSGEQPTYEDWRRLLAQEARAAAYGQGNNRLEVVLGDSMGLWLPPDMLPSDRLWLNQGISGDTTGGILQRLSAFAETHPTKIHLLAGVNDLKNGVPQTEIVANMERIITQLQQQHPQADIVVYSVFPTRWETIPNQHVRSLNARISRVAQRSGASYRDVHGQFQDQWGALRAELTTDGLHLNAQGYQVWQRAML